MEIRNDGRRKLAPFAEGHRTFFPDLLRAPWYEHAIVASAIGLVAATDRPRATAAKDAT